MAIAEGILDIARDCATREGAARVTKIGLLLGAMAGVEEEALRFCFASLARGTPAEDAALSVTRVPLAGRCGACGHEQPIEGYDFVCPACGGGLAIVTGRELRVEYVEME